MARQSIEYDGHIFDSNEEVGFYKWCVEAKEHGFIKYFDYHVDSYRLSDPVYFKWTEEVVMKTKTKIVEKKKTILRGHNYTPDFSICPTEKFKEQLIGFPWIETITPNEVIKIDVKGTHKTKGNVSFEINRKWVYDMYGVLIYKVVPEDLFLATWVPEKCRYTAVKKDVIKKYINCKTIKDMK